MLRPQSNERSLLKSSLANKQEFLGNDDSAYNHTQQVANLYGSYAISSRKLKLDLGLRYEYQKINCCILTAIIISESILVTFFHH